MSAISLPHGFSVHYELSNGWLQDSMANMPFANPRVDGQVSQILVTDSLELLGKCEYECGIMLDMSCAPVSVPSDVILFQVEEGESFVQKLVALVTTISQGNASSLMNIQRHHVQQMDVLRMSLEEAVVWTDEALTILSFSDSAAAVFKQRRTQLRGMSFLDVLSCDGEDVQAMLLKRAEVNATDKMELEGTLQDGSKIYLMVGIRPVAKNRYQINMKDVSSQGAADKRFMQLANYDPITGLANRGLLFEFLGHATARSKRSNRLVALMILDLDPFERVQDDTGAQMGDDLLKSAASRIKSLIHDQDMLARWGGDELAIVMEDLEHPDTVSRTAQRIMSALSSPFMIDGRDYYLSPSIGIAVFPEADETVNGLIQAANTAMFEAKKDDGRNTYRFYQSKLQEVAEQRAKIEQALLRAIENEEFALFYQPKVSIAKEQVTGFEALLRWNHPEWRTVSPEVYIPIAEECGLIQQIGDWVLREACQQMSSWQEDFPQLKDCSVAINVSTKQLTDLGFAGRVASTLEHCSLDVEKLEIEITESSVMEDPEQSIEILNKIHDLGVKVSIDDFGTGYSSLSYISEFEFDKIKIDRSFVASIQDDERARAIITTIIGLGRALDIMITAEGIETNEQLLLIQAAGCHFGQGYLFGRPVPLSEIIDKQSAEANQEKPKVNPALISSRVA